MIQIDIPMPEHCYDCPCHDGESGFCQITGKYYYDEIPRSCPLVELPSVQPERWDTCFSCPLSHGCPVIKGCTNDQAEQYAGEIPADCPLDKESAQPEIIRCKDCAFWNKGSCYCEDIEVHGLEYYVGDIHTEENDFCSYAERRADE